MLDEVRTRRRWEVGTILGCSGVFAAASIFVVWFAAGAVHNRKTASDPYAQPLDPAAQKLAAATTHLPDDVIRVDGLMVGVDDALRGRDVDFLSAPMGTAHSVVEGWKSDGVAGRPEVASHVAAFDPRYAHFLGIADLHFGRERIKLKDYISADATLEEGQTQVASIPAGYPLADALPALSKDLAAARRKIAPRLAKAARDEARREAKAKKDADAAQAMRAMCGRAPEPDPWDGGLTELDRVIERSGAGDVDSENCTPPSLTKKCWYVECTVKGQNAFGAKIAPRMGFYMMYTGPGPYDYVVEEAR